MQKVEIIESEKRDEPVEIFWTEHSFHNGFNITGCSSSSRKAR